MQALAELSVKIIQDNITLYQPKLYNIFPMLTTSTGTVLQPASITCDAAVPARPHFVVEYRAPLRQYVVAFIYNRNESPFTITTAYYNAEDKPDTDPKPEHVFLQRLGYSPTALHSALHPGDTLDQWRVFQSKAPGVEKATALTPMDLADADKHQKIITINIRPLTFTQWPAQSYIPDTGYRPTAAEINSAQQAFRQAYISSMPEIKT